MSTALEMVDAGIVSLGSRTLVETSEMLDLLLDLRQLLTAEAAWAELQTQGEQA